MAEVSLSKFELRRTSLFIEQLAIFSDMSGRRSMSWHATRGTGLVVVVAVTACRAVGSVLTSCQFSTCGSTSTSFFLAGGVEKMPRTSRSCKLHPARCSQCGRTMCPRFTAQTQRVRTPVIKAICPASCSLMASLSMTVSSRPSSPSGALAACV